MAALQRSLSTVNHLRKSAATEEARIYRRGSHDNLSGLPNHSSFVVDVETTVETLLHREDTDNDGQITIDDLGPQTFRLGTTASLGYRSFDVRGTYKLSNLLQELVTAQENKHKLTIIPRARLDENPVHRLRRLITNRFWANLERRLDESVIHIAAPDPKDYTENPQPRIYVPKGTPDQYEYYVDVAKRRPELRLDVVSIPSNITNEVYREIIKKPGILALEMEKFVDPKTGKQEMRGLPFIVPGGCFNELYNWDSYFIALGLLADGKTDLVKALVQNFIFEIQHYGLIPNANRSYYLLRSQPPFLTDLALRTYGRISNEPGAKEFLKRAILASIKEYYKVWVSEPRYDPVTGLSRYRPAGVAVPPECSTEHFANILQPYADKYGLGLEEFREKYNAGEFNEAELDEYFLHDRGLRESGHDVSLRVENSCGDLATIDLNCLLYKYEIDIARCIRTLFDDSLVVPPDFCIPGQEENRTEHSAIWDRRARRRKQAIDTYLWNEEKGIYLDYNTKTMQQTTFESVTCLWALWCGVATPHQASLLVKLALPRFERVGGLLSTNEDWRGKVSCHEAHQWDYPYGWAPHQVMAWDGLLKYGYNDEAERLAYRWCYMITKIFVDFNGTVVEKYDVTQTVESHKVTLDYGNQGLGFKGYAKEGFGWTNASYVHGLEILTTHAKRALGVLAPFSIYAAAAGKFDNGLDDPSPL